MGLAPNLSKLRRQVEIHFVLTVKIKKIYTLTTVLPLVAISLNTVQHNISFNVY